MSLEDVRNIATIVAALVAVVGIVPLFRNLVTAERNLRAKIYFDALTLVEGKDNENRALRHVLEDAVKRAKRDGRTFDILQETIDVQKKLDDLARVYDRVGLLVKHGVVPTEFLFDFYSRPIVNAWLHIRPLISVERTTRGQPNHMVKFELLAVGAALYRSKKYSETPPFSIPPESRRTWQLWRPWHG